MNNTMTVSNGLPTPPLDNTYSQLVYDDTSDQLLVYSNTDGQWLKIDQSSATIQVDWQDTLESIPIAEIERFLRRKKLNNISEI